MGNIKTLILIALKKSRLGLNTLWCMGIILSGLCLGGCMQGHYLCPLPHGHVGCLSQLAAYQGSLARVPVEVPLTPVMPSTQKTHTQPTVWVVGYRDVAGHLIVGHGVLLGEGQR